MQGGGSSRRRARRERTLRTTARWRDREGRPDCVLQLPRGHPAGGRLLQRAGAGRAMSEKSYGFLRDNSLSLGFGVVFLATLTGQAISGLADYNAQQITNGLATESFLGYVSSSNF